MPHHRLLIVEDDYEVAEMLTLYFTRFHYEVLHAGSGEDGIEAARKSFPNLILLDVMMPDTDGYEVCRRLRQMTFTKYIPIIFLTQRDQRADKLKGLELGADDYVTKPFDLEELRLRVSGAIRRATRENLIEARTGLPTGSLVKDELRRFEALSVQREQVYEALSLEIDGLEPFRDVYGFIATDGALSFAAQCIRQAVARHGTADDFVGILDNRFLLVTAGGNLPTLESTIKARFAAGVRAFYSHADQEQGGLVLNRGTSGEQHLPFMRVITAGVEV